MTITLNSDLNRFIAICFEKNTLRIMVAGSNLILDGSNLSGCVDTWKPTCTTSPRNAATLTPTKSGRSIFADSIDTRYSSSRALRSVSEKRENDDM